jgi:hypothetical protein
VNPTVDAGSWARGMQALDAITVLEPVTAHYGNAPQHVSSDNGPQSIAKIHLVAIGKMNIEQWVTSRYSRVNTQAGALSLVSCQALPDSRDAEGQDPVRKMDNGSPEAVESI